MTDFTDKPEQATASGAACTENGMRDTLDNLAEFALMLSRHSSIRALEILEVTPPDRGAPLATPGPVRPATVIPHPATRKPRE